MVRGVSADKLLDDKLKVVVVGVALQKPRGELMKTSNRQVKMTARDLVVLDMAGHTRSRAKTHEGDKVREDERNLTGLTSDHTAGEQPAGQIDEPEI